jgi:chemotaxis protein methyltransferase WspC
LAASTGFQPVNQTMSFAFRRSDARQKYVAPLCKQPGGSKTAPATRRSLVRPGSPRPAAPPAAVPKALHLEDASRLADAGELKEAGALCEALIKEQGPSSRAFYLLGLVRDAAGDGKAAADYYRKALYLEPNHPEALLHLALFFERQGDGVAAARLRERARRIDRNVNKG